MSKPGARPATLTMPRLGETMERGIVAEWLVKEGEAFKRGDAIVEFETDKTAVEYPALGDGILAQQLVAPGDEVVVGEPIALIDIGEGPDWLRDDSDTANFTYASSAGVSDPDAKSSHTTSTSTGISASPSVQTGPLRATPVARKLARASGITLAMLSGTGRRGRIEAHDVEVYTRNLPLVPRHTQAAVPINAAQNFSDAELLYADGISYRAAGPAKGPNYLLLHGFAADATAWSLLTLALVNAGCRVVAVDLPGHGATRSEAPDVDSLHTGLQAVMDASSSDKENPQPWHVIAHSLGALPALKLAQSLVDDDNDNERQGKDLQLRSLSLIAPVGLGLSIDRQFIKTMAQPSSVAEVSHLLRRLSDRPSTLTDHAVKGLFAVLGKRRLVQLAESMLSTQGQAMDTHESIRVLAKKLPLRIIIGHADRIIEWQETLQVSPMVAVHHFPTAGHMPHWDFPGEVAEIILASQ